MPLNSGRTPGQSWRSSLKKARTGTRTTPRLTLQTSSLGRSGIRALRKSKWVIVGKSPSHLRSRWLTAYFSSLIVDGPLGFRSGGFLRRLLFLDAIHKFLRFAVFLRFATFLFRFRVNSL